MSNVSTINVNGQSYPVSSSASNVTYDNTTSQISATNVQSAIDLIIQSGGGGGLTPIILSDILVAGATSITFTDNRIPANAKIFPLTSVYGVNPTDITSSTGSIVVTFESQASNINVELWVF